MAITQESAPHLVLTSEAHWQGEPQNIPWGCLGAKAVARCFGQMTYQTTGLYIRAILGRDPTSVSLPEGASLPILSGADDADLLRVVQDTRRVGGRAFKHALTPEGFDQHVADMEDSAYRGPVARLVVDAGDKPINLTRAAYYYRPLIFTNVLAGMRSDEVDTLLPRLIHVSPSLTVGQVYQGGRRSIIKVSEAARLHAEGGLRRRRFALSPIRA